MRTIEKTVFQFDELSEAAKESAREWYRSRDCDNFFAESVIDDAVDIAALFGLEIDQKKWTNRHSFTGSTPCVYWSGFGSQGDGASFEGDYRYAKNAVDLVASHTGNDSTLVDIARRLQTVQKRHFYGLRATISQTGNYCHEYTMRADVWHVNDKAVDDTDTDDLLDCFRDFARWIYRQLEKENDYQNSDECVDESITINEYEFTEEGERA